MTKKLEVVDDKPKPKVFREKIGHREYELEEHKLDVFDEVVLWPDNPRLMPYLAEHGGNVESEQDLELFLKRTERLEAENGTQRRVGISLARGASYFYHAVMIRAPEASRWAGLRGRGGRAAGPAPGGRARWRRGRPRSRSPDSLDRRAR